MPDICHLMCEILDLFKLLIRCLDNLVEVNYLKLFNCFLELIFNQFINFSQAFSKSRVKVILNTVICSKIIDNLTFLSSDLQL